MTLTAHGCQNGHLTMPSHARCPECGAAQTATVDMTDRTAEIVTWTTSTATPPGVRRPNHLGIVAFTVDGTEVRTLGQLTTDSVRIGDTVEPIPVEELRDPEAGIRIPASQSWSGYRFAPVDDD